MIADNPSQWISRNTDKTPEWEQAMTTVLRSYIRKRVAEGRDIDCLRQDMLTNSLYSELLIKIFSQEIANN